jgi:hypothetical protein
VIVPDRNLLVYVHNEAAAQHVAARAWWEDLMAREAPIGLAWAVALGFIRLLTHPAVLVEPLRPTDVVLRVEAWMARANVQIVEPGPRHLRILHDLFVSTGVGGALTTDTHLAALAIEHQAELHSNDSDFGRFPGLRWRNPLA